MADDLKVSLGVELDGSYDDVKKKIDDLKNGNGKDNKIQIQVDTKQADAQIKSFKNSIQGKTPAKIIIDVNKSVSNANITAFRNSLLSKFTSNPVRMIIDVNKSQSNANLKAYLDGIKNQLQNIPITLTPGTGNGNGSGNKGGGGNTPAPSVPNNIPTQPVPKNLPASKGGFVGTSKLIERGSVDEWGAFIKTGEVEKTNLALGETVTIYRELNEETQEFDETSRQYETNYEAQAKAAEKAAEERKKQWTDQLKYNSKQLELEQKWKDEREKILSEQNTKVADLESRAFNQATPLTGEFETKVRDAITPWTDAINALQSGTGKVTSDMENKLKSLEATANRVFKEQRQAQHGGSDLTPDDISMRVINAGADLDVQVQKLQQMGMYSTEVKTAFDGLKDSLSRVQDVKGFNEWKDAWQQINNEVKLYQEEIKTANKAENFKLDTKIIENQLENLRTKYEEIISNNPSKQNSEIEDKFRNIADALQNVDITKIPVLRKQLQELRTEINGLQPQTLSQVLQQSFGGIGQYLSRFVSAAFIIQKSIGVTKKMVAEVTSVDSSLVELQKVTTLSGDSLDQFVDKAYNVGEGLGRTGKDVVDAVTTFSRAGYDLNEATQLAQSALVMSNVGVDIPNTEAAASDMISILKAFDKQADESMQVIDKLYNVANKEPLDFGNITDMLVTAGGTLAQTNTSLEETMGLLTGAFATLRDNSVANGLVMISQRLRGVKEDGEAMEADFIPKLKKAFADVGISIEDQNGELRSTFDILQDLAARWDDLSSKQKQFLGEKAAGNRQVKTLNAIMANWDVVQDTIDKANEATGAATEGNEKYLDSIQGRITAFQSAFQNLARTTIDSGFVKGIVSIGTGLVNITTKLGGLLPMLSTISGFILVFKGAKIVDSIKAAVPALTQLFSSLSAGVPLLTSLKALLSTPIGMIGGILTAVGVIASVASVIKNAQKSQSDLNDQAAASKQNYEDQKEKVASLNDKLTETQSLLRSMEGKKLTVLEQGEKERLEGVNAELQRQIELEQKRLEISQSQAREDAVKAGSRYNASVSDANNVDLIDAVGGEQEFARIAGIQLGQGGNAREQLANYSISTAQEVQLRLAELQHAKEEYRKITEEIAKTDPKDTETTDNLEKQRTEWDNRAKEADRWLNDYLAYLETLTSGLTKVENPTGLDVAFNALIDLRETISDALVFSADSDKSKSDQFSTIIARYPEQLNAVKDKIKELSQEVAADSKEMKDAVRDSIGSEMMESFTNLGWSEEDVTQALIESFSGGEGAIDGFVSIMSDLISKNFLATESYKNLTAAMTEQQKAGTISMETYQALMDDEGLPGIQNYLVLTAEGFALNTESLYDYIKAMNDEMKVKAIDELVEKRKALEDLQETLRTTTDEQERVNAASMAEKTQSDIDALQAYINSLETATGALERYRAAQKAPQGDENYNEGQNALKDIKEGWKSGKVGTPKYQEAMGFFLGENWRTNEQYQGEKGQQKAQKDAEKLGNRYFKDERTGVNNFIKDLEKLGKVSDKVNFTEDGKLEIADDTSIQEIAQGLSEVTGNAEMSEDAVTSLFELLQTYTPDKFDWSFLNPPEDPNVTQRRKELQDAKDAGTAERDRLIQERNAAEKKGDTSKVEELNQKISEADKNLATLDQQLEEVGSNTEFNLETSSIDELQNKLQNVQDLIVWLQGIGVTNVEANLTGTAEDISIEIEDRISKLTGGPNNVPIDATDETAEGVSSANENLGKVKAPDTVELKANPASLILAVGSALVSLGLIKPEVVSKIIAENNTETGINEALTNLNNNFGESNPIPAIVNAVAGMVEETTNTIDAIATKERTATITVKYEPPEEGSEFGLKDGDSINDVVNGSGLGAVKNENGNFTWTSIPNYVTQLFDSLKSKTGADPGAQDLINAAAEDVESGNAAWDGLGENLNQFAADYAAMMDQLRALNNDWNPGDNSNNNPEEPSPDKTNISPNPPSSQEMLDEKLRIKYEASLENPDAIAEEAQEAADSNPIEMPMELEPPEEPVEVEVEYKTPTEPMPGPAPSPTPTPTPEATPNPSSITQSVNADTSAAESAINSLDRQAEDGATKPVDANVSSALNAVSQLDKAASKSVTKTIKVETTGEPYAKGTDYAAKGPSLVDEEGAELIEHTKRGTYELGTNNGARMTYLDKGDVVHTARETKTILSRMAKVGGFFRDGLNKGKSIIGGAFARGVSGSISLSNIKRVLSSSRKSIGGGTKGSNSSSASGTSNKKFKKWAEKLFDWAEIRLARLKTVTNGWLLSAAEAIGYMAQNAELTNALGAVEDEIEATTAAYDLYIKQADEVQKKAKLSDDIVEKIKQGNIEISSYKKEIQEKIKEYQKWYEKALACSDALNDLREQERDLAKQKLDNILTHYNNRIDRLDNIVRQRESDLALAEAQGRELQASEYDTSISATTQKYEELIAQRDALVKEMNQLISQGLIDKESDTWHEYTGKLEDAENAITETRTAIIELHDEANKVELTKLGYQLDALANTAAHITDLMDLHASQVAEEMPEVYKDLIDNGMDQIKNLEEQNEELRKQQEGLDVLSQKYQDLEEQIQSNISTINQMKVSQEQWNDSVLDLKIAQLEKYRDSLNKMNDQYERQKELQEAIEELQKVQGQRTQRVFKSGVGFVYEADQDALKDAQENLENVIKDQLLSRIDDLIDALEEEKNNTNVYDYEGNLLGTEYSLPQLGTLTEILSGYYNSNIVPNFSGLKGSLYDQIIAGANNNNSMQFNFGDINLSEVNDVNTLGEAIVDLLPNAILQAINKKG